MLDQIILILLIILVLLALIAITFLAYIIISKSKEESKMFRDSVLKIHEDGMKTSNDINIRLISIVTEALLGSGPLTNSDTGKLSQDLRERDEDLLKGVLGTQASEPFDPFSYSGSAEEKSEPALGEPIENLLEKSSVVQKKEE